jgi:hypothetical protein
MVELVLEVECVEQALACRGVEVGGAGCVRVEVAREAAHHLVRKVGDVGERDGIWVTR